MLAAPTSGPASSSSVVQGRGRLARALQASADPAVLAARATIAEARGCRPMVSVGPRRFRPGPGAGFFGEWLVRGSWARVLGRSLSRSPGPRTFRHLGSGSQ